MDDDIRRKLSGEVKLIREDGETAMIHGTVLMSSVLLAEITTCVASQELHMLYSPPWSGQYKQDTILDLQSALTKKYKLPDRAMFIPSDGNIDIFQKEFETCSHPYFYIPLVLYPTTSETIHANGILVNRSNGSVYRIEPQGDLPEATSVVQGRIDSMIDEGILTALREVGVQEPKLYDLNITCPQTLAKDGNCMFWTLYMTHEILRQIDTKEPRDVVREITASLPDIEAFKTDLLNKRIPTFLQKYNMRLDMKGGMYWPEKYFKGLTRSQSLQRKRSATRRRKMSSKNPKAYVPFKSDKGVKTRKSSYTERFHKKYPGVTSMPAIAKATGIRKSILDTVYDRGMAAWRTGHRPGASQQAWGMARVYSFALKGKTWRTADSDLARKV